MRKFSILLSFLLLAGLLANAQLRYKKLYPEAMQTSPEEAFDMFTEYQKQDPKHVNTYYQLGLLSLNWMKSYDPLLSYKDVATHCYNSKLYFGLASYNLDERDVKRDRDYFQTIKPGYGEKLMFEDVKHYIDSVYAFVQEYEVKAREINYYFNRSIDFFNAALDLYKQINNRNASFKDLMLTVDDKFLNDANMLKSNYDSAMVYFQRYKNEVSTYPYINYDQQIQLIPITTYRLEGLAAQSFMQPIIQLPNYGAWVDSLYRNLNVDIAELRTAIAEADQQMDLGMQFLASPMAMLTPDFSIYRLNNGLRYQIGKFDNNSLMLNWLEYRDAQIDFFQRSKMPEINLNDTNHVALERRLRTFEPAVFAKQRADSLLRVFELQLQESKVQKYRPVFVKKYGGLSGLQRQLSYQAARNDSMLQADFEAIRHFWKQRENEAADSIFANYKDAKLSFVPGNMQTAAVGEYVSLAVQETADGACYIAGVQKTTDDAGKFFLAYSANGQTIDWVRKPKLKGIKDATGLVLQALRKGAALVVHGQQSAQVLLNTFVRFDEFGNVQVETTMQSDAIPAYVYYDDINETILSVYHTAATSDILAVYMNQVDGTALWTQQANLQGQLSGIAKMDQQYLLLINFQKFTTPLGTHQSDIGSELLCWPISTDGTPQQAIVYTRQKNYNTRYVAKLNSNAVAVLGTSPNQKLALFLLDAHGKLVYTNQ